MKLLLSFYFETLEMYFQKNCLTKKYHLQKVEWCTKQDKPVMLPGGL